MKKADKRDTKIKYDRYDYTTYTMINTHYIDRERVNIGDWFLNQIECLHCGDIIRSKNRRDYVECSCHKVAVDGGSWYLKRMGQQGDYREMSVQYNIKRPENV